MTGFGVVGWVGRCREKWPGPEGIWEVWLVELANGLGLEQRGLTWVKQHLPKFMSTWNFRMGPSVE